MNKKQFQQEAYRLYQLRWLADHGFSVEDVIRRTMETEKAINAELDEGDRASNQDVIEEIETRDGIDGGSLIYACYKEFLETEYLDAYYMKGLLEPEHFREYLRLTEGKRNSYSDDTSFQERMTLGRALQLLNDVAKYIKSAHEETFYKVKALRDAGFTADEIEQLGYEPETIEHVVEAIRSLPK